MLSHSTIATLPVKKLWKMCGFTAPIFDYIWENYYEESDSPINKADMVGAMTYVHRYPNRDRPLNTSFINQRDEFLSESRIRHRFLPTLEFLAQDLDEILWSDRHLPGNSVLHFPPSSGVVGQVDTIPVHTNEPHVNTVLQRALYNKKHSGGIYTCQLGEMSDSSSLSQFLS